MKWDGVNIILDDLGAYIKSPYTTDDLKFPPSGNYNERTRNIVSNSSALRQLHKTLIYPLPV